MKSTDFGALNPKLFSWNTFQVRVHLFHFSTLWSLLETLNVYKSWHVFTYCVMVMVPSFFTTQYVNFSAKNSNAGAVPTFNHRTDKTPYILLDIVTFDFVRIFRWSMPTTFEVLEILVFASDGYEKARLFFQHYWIENGKNIYYFYYYVFSYSFSLH